MPSPEHARQALVRLFERQQIADLDSLFAALRTRSRMTVFRRLTGIGYFTSYSHTGRFYTLESLPAFDAAGLWRHQGVGFSRDGTLKATVVRLVEESEAGRFHRELEEQLQVRVHNTLLDRVRHGRLGRELLVGEYLYVSGDRARATAQVARRREAPASPGKTEEAKLAPSAVIEVLVEVIHGGRLPPDASAVAARLRARGIGVSVEQVEQVFAERQLKKTARSRSRRSRR